MKLRLILDRIEEDTAVLTDENMSVYECDVGLLPIDSREGCALFGELDEDGKVVSLYGRNNPEAGKNRRRLLALFNKNPKNKKINR